MRFDYVDGPATAIEVMSSDSDGPALLLVPGAMGGMRGYLDLCQRLAGPGFAVAAMNPRGSGGTKDPVQEVTMHDLAADLAAVVEHFGGPAVVLGHAGGNRIARVLATDRPELVSRLVLLAAGGHIPPTPDAAAALAEAASSPELSQAAEDRLTSALLAPGATRPEGFPPPDRSALAFQVARRAGQATPRDEWWAGGATRMLVIQGAQDHAAPPANGHALAAEFPDRVKVVDIEQAGHLMHLEQPGAVVRAISSYLSDEGVLHAGRGRSS
jgi:pimeloyl-ACP methyl ester carboxylesterase